MVLQQQESQYDAGGHVLLVTARQRFHDETATGALGDPTTGPKARVSYTAAYYDKADRLTAAVDVGTNGGSAYTRPAGRFESLVKNTERQIDSAGSSHSVEIG